MKPPNGTAEESFPATWPKPKDKRDLATLQLKILDSPRTDGVGALSSLRDCPREKKNKKTKNKTKKPQSTSELGERQP